jgi:urea carboxylase
MTISAPTRWRVKEAAAAAGCPVLLGPPRPAGRDIVVSVRGGRVAGDRDDSARWRGRLLWSVAPAALPEGRRASLHRLAMRLTEDLGGGDLDLGFAVDDDGEHLVDVARGATVAPTGAGVTATITIAAGEPACGRATVSGRITGMSLPAGAQCALRIGQVVEVPAWTPLATITVTAADQVALHGAMCSLLDAGDQPRGELGLASPGTVAGRRQPIDGLATTVHLLRAALAAPAPADARSLDALTYAPPVIEVVAGGTHTTVQDAPGRLGLWEVGVPPSGPMDDLAFRLANRLVGNDAGTAGLECTLVGPRLRFHAPAVICLAGPPRSATVDGVPLPPWRPVAVPAGTVVDLGPPGQMGCRSALAVRGGIAVPDCLGSRATFDLGGFGGHAGRPLAAGDVLAIGPEPTAPVADGPLPVAARPTYVRTWELGVLEGPHAAPDFFTGADLREIYAATWTVSPQSNRTGVRLVGPKPRWARTDGGEAGLHPSNIHDNAYAIGAIDFTGDMPVLLGPDGPSLGGFVCPAVVASAERWKLGQLRPGDNVRLRRLTPAQAHRLAERQAHLIGHLAAPPEAVSVRSVDPGDAILRIAAATAERPRLKFRRQGDRNLLVELGPELLDLDLRLRVHQLQAAIRAERIAGIIDLTPGVRSLQLHVDPAVLPLARAVDLVDGLAGTLGDPAATPIPCRTIHLPLSWDDPACRKAIDIYMRTVNPTAPWCPSNLEFIRRINGLDSIDTVKRIVFGADYLVVGLGDVYLGAPVATPIDPRHRLVTTKYNPARTWTPENAVGIGGAYMCIYGMEGPGGYQFVGRTVPVWNTWNRTPEFQQPWLLRHFDRIRWYEVSADELLRLREGVRSGDVRLRIDEGSLDWAAERTRLHAEADAITAFTTRQRAAFAAEREAWADAEKRRGKR